ncbi:hypothetical protein SARC_12836, partial [Sphaeroforma arctica JP610]
SPCSHMIEDSALAMIAADFIAHIKLTLSAIKVSAVQTTGESTDIDIVAYDNRYTLVAQYHTVGYYTVEEPMNKPQLVGHIWSRQKEYANQYIEGYMRRVITQYNQ